MAKARILLALMRRGGQDITRSSSPREATGISSRFSKSVESGKGDRRLGCNMSKRATTEAPKDIRTTRVESAEQAPETPLQEYLREWREKGEQTVRFFRQRSAILHDPRILHEAHASKIRGWKAPLAFAAYGLVLTSAVISATDFVLTNVMNIEQPKQEWFASPERLSADLKTNEDFLQKASRLSQGQTIPLTRSGGVREFDKDNAVRMLTKENRKIRRERMLIATFGWVIEYLQPIFGTLSIILGSAFFKKSIVKNLDQSRFGDQADRYYLYVVTSRLFWANVLLNIAWASGLLELLCIGTAVGIYLLYRSSKDLYIAFDVSPPRSYWTGANKTFTALTSANINSFFVIALAELALGAVFYGIIIALA